MRVLALGACAVLLLAASGCLAHARPQMRFSSQLNTEAGQFNFEFGERDREAKEKVAVAIEAASHKLAQWGGLREPVTVFVLPTHNALEEAVNRNGYEWLRAWARYDEIFLQSPRTWSVFGAPQSDVNELVLHELTHSVMYQQAADRTHWARKGIPLWFREGMASWTAQQGYRWPSLEDLARFYEKHEGMDPVADPDPLYQRESNIVYGGAHHAFSFLVKRYGTDRVRQVLAQMRGGQDFEEAFSSALGLSPEAFLRDFKRFVRLRGFRGRERIRQLKPVVAPPPAATPEEPVPVPEPVPPEPERVPPPPGEPSGAGQEPVSPDAGM